MGGISMKWIISCVAATILIVALPAAAKKRPIELDPGFFRWDKFSYSELPEAKKAQLRGSNIVNRWGYFYVEFDHTVITYDGDSTLTSDRSLRLVMAAESVPERFYVARIDPSLGESLEVNRIVLRRKGKPDEVYTHEDLFEEASASWFGYYDSDRLYYLDLPEDAADATLDMDISVVTHSQPGFEGFVQTSAFLQSHGLCQERTLTFRYPEEHPLYLDFRGFEAKLKPKRDGGTEEVSLTLRQLFPFREERWSASSLANYPAILASSMQTWDAYHALALPLYEDKMVVDDALRGEVARLTDGLETERDKAQAIYRFVAADLHYLGLYAGESGWVPHTAPEVLEQRFGDCKDHTILLTTMLREAGIQAQPAFIRVGRMGFVDQGFPFVFANHAIVYATVDGEGMFLDGTASPFEFEAPSRFILDRTALVLGEQGMEFVETPAGTAADASWIEEVDLTVNFDGSLEAEARVTYGGSEAADLRDRFRTRPLEEVARQDRGWVASKFVLAEDVSLVQEDEPASGSGPLTRTLTLRSTEHVRNLGSVMLLELPVLEVPGGIEPIQDAHDFPVWVTPLSYEMHMTIQLPLGYYAVELPDDNKSIRPTGTIEAEFDEDGRTIRIDVTATWNYSRVAAAAAESYAQFRTELAEVLEQELVLVKGGAR
jgi:transglutaminase-like putative cysteine protease